jgi:hypothetical protein
MKKLKAKRLLSLFLAVMMVFTLAACGGNGGGDDTSTPPASGGNDPTVTVDPTPITPTVPVVASIDFEDGNFDFAMIYTNGPVATDAELAVVDWNGSKALQVTNTGGDGRVYAAIDVSSVLGADITKVASVEMLIGTAHAGGAFSAVSGSIYSWVGEDRTQVSDTWAVYLPSKNPMPAVATAMDGLFVADANNMIIVTLIDDNGPADGNGHATFFIDDIRFLDGAGNVLMGDTTVAFNAPAGFASEGGDLAEVDLGFSGSTTADWDPFIQMDTDKNEGPFDRAWLGNGFAINVYYSGDNTPECIMQSWSGGEGWAKVTAAEDDGSKAVFTIDGIIAAYGDDFSLLDAVRVGSAEGALEVYSVTVTIPAQGTKIDLGFSGSTTADWDPFIQIDTAKNEGPFDIGWLVNGFTIAVSYNGENTPECIMQSWSGGEGWAKVTAVSDDGSTAVFDLNGIIAAYGDDFSLLDAVRVGSAEGALEVYAVVVTVPGGGAETDLGYSGSTTSDWDPFIQIDTEKNEGDFNTAWLTNGFTITVFYSGENTPECIMQSWSGGGVSGWDKVTAVSDDGSKAVFDLNGIIAAYGDDFSLLDAVRVGSAEGALEVYSVTVNR